MGTINVRIDTDNAAFGESAEERAAELARIFRDLADRLDNDPSSFENRPGIKDAEGNTTGHVTVQY